MFGLKKENVREWVGDTINQYMLRLDEQKRIELQMAGSLVQQVKKVLSNPG